MRFWRAPVYVFPRAMWLLISYISFLLLALCVYYGRNRYMGQRYGRVLFPRCFFLVENRNVRVREPGSIGAVHAQRRTDGRMLAAQASRVPPTPPLHYLLYTLPCPYVQNGIACARVCISAYVRHRWVPSNSPSIRRCMRRSGSIDGHIAVQVGRS
jgi:hypothetical protein